MQIRKLWDTACSFVGPAFVLFVIARSSSTYQIEWSFGQYGMPETLVAADGVSYPNGKPIPPPILALVQTGYEAEMNLVAFGFLGSIAVFLGWLYWRTERLRPKAIEQAIDEEKWYRERREAAQHLRRNGIRTYKG